MAYTGTLCAEAEINLFAGELVDATGNTEANHNYLVAHAQSYLCVLCKFNWIDEYASLNADVKAILSEYCARYAAASLIAYNMAGYTSRIEAEDMINVHLHRMKAIEKILIEQAAVKYMDGA
jgi:hypothetical protein